MEKKKQIQVGSIWVNDVKLDNGESIKVPSISLGNFTNKDPKYNYHVELIVKDSSGKVIASLDTSKDPKKRYVRMYEPKFTDKTSDVVRKSKKYDLTIDRE